MLHVYILWYTCKVPVTVPTSRSATVRFIMTYVLRLRKWWILAKAVIVTALIINITRNSAMKTGKNTECFVMLISHSVIILSAKYCHAGGQGDKKLFFPRICMIKKLRCQRRKTPFSCPPAWLP